MSGMAKTTSDSILGVIWKFELMLTRCTVNMQIRETAVNMPNMVMPPGEQHGVGGGLRSLSAFLVSFVNMLHYHFSWSLVFNVHVYLCFILFIF